MGACSSPRTMIFAMPRSRRSSHDILPPGHQAEVRGAGNDGAIPLGPPGSRKVSKAFGNADGQSAKPVERKRIVPLVRRQVAQFKATCSDRWPNIELRPADRIDLAKRAEKHWSGKQRSQGNCHCCAGNEWRDHDGVIWGTQGWQSEWRRIGTSTLGKNLDSFKRTANRPQSSRPRRRIFPGAYHSLKPLWFRSSSLAEFARRRERGAP
jgi:hypothetical protein